MWALGAVVSRAHAVGVTARIHLKIDTGLSRNGSYVRDWPALIAAASAAADGGQVEIVAIWSHFAHADEPGHPMIARQLEAFEAALAVAGDLGVAPPYRHLANSAATLTLPESHYDLVRVGVAIYGLNPVPQRPVPQLRPAMTLRSHVALSKFVEAGEGVSYGHQYTTKTPGTLALIPLGYADGIPRHGSNVGPVSIGGWRGQVSGRVCMDQFVVDLGRHEVAEGAEVVIFGAGDDGEPTAQEWADAADTIHYEIVTRIGARVPRRYVGPRELIQP
jgi:alanine racemase